MLIFGYGEKTITAGCCLAAPAGKDAENSGKLAIRPEQPRCRIKVKLCVVRFAAVRSKNKNIIHVN